MYIKKNTKRNTQLKYKIQRGGIEGEFNIEKEGEYKPTKNPKKKTYKIINYNKTKYAIRKGSKNLYHLNSTSGKQELGRKISSSSNHPINKIIKGYIKYSSKEPKTTFTVIKKDGRYNLHKKIKKNNSSYLSKKIKTF